MIPNAPSGCPVIDVRVENSKAVAWWFTPTTAPVFRSAHVPAGGGATLKEHDNPSDADPRQRVMNLHPHTLGQGGILIYRTTGQDRQIQLSG